MSDPFIDTDVVIRLLTGDDPTKQDAAAALFTRVQDGTVTLAAPVTMIADAVYVLSSSRLYRLHRDQIRDLLTTLLRLPAFKVDNRLELIAALDLYARTNLDFGDAFIVACMHARGASIVYSYDHDFDGLSGVSRSEP